MKGMRFAPRNREVAQFLDPAVYIVCSTNHGGRSVGESTKPTLDEPHWSRRFRSTGADQVKTSDLPSLSE
jgi:hypothetical protein